MNISKYFIQNPIPGILLFILLSVAGINSFLNMKVTMFPDINAPIFVITIPQPGATPEQLENDVAKVVENKISNIEGIKFIRTTLVDNATTIFAGFSIDISKQKALDRIKTAIDEIRGSLPSSAKTPVITSLVIGNNPLFIYAISSDKLDLYDLSWLIDNTIAKKILSINGVSTVKRVGGIDREIQINPNPYILEKYKTNVAMISQQLKAIQKNFQAGEANIKGANKSIKIPSPVKSIKDLAKININLPNGEIVKLGNIATIKDTHKEQKIKAILGKKETIELVIKRSSSAGDIKLGKQIENKIEEIRKENPNIKITQAFETVSGTKEDFKGAMNMLIDGAVLASLVVLIFLGGIRPTILLVVSAAIAYIVYSYLNNSLGMILAVIILLIPIILYFDDYRTTIISSISLPLSIIPVFWGMDMLGLSINMMVTLAFSLVIGIIVDDTIVEVENIDRHMSMGVSPYNAAISATNEIGTAVIAITMTLIAVFLPTAFMPGISGQFFYQFGVAASLAIFSSLLVARIITPILSSKIMRAPRKKKENLFFINPYLKLIKWTIRFRWLVLLLSIVFFVLSMVVLFRIPGGFVPQNNSSNTVVQIELPPNSNINETQDITNKAYDIIKKSPFVKSTFTTIGQEGARKAEILVTLVDMSKRPSRQDIEEDIRNQLINNIPGANFSLISLSNGEQITLILASDNANELKKSTDSIMKELKSIKELGTIINDTELNKQELIIHPDYDKLAYYGVTPASIAQTMRIATKGDYADFLTKLNTKQRQIPIVVKLDDKYKKDINILKNTIVIGSKGPVKIGDVATINIESTPIKITRYNKKRFARIKIEIIRGSLGNIQKSINNLPAIKNLPKSIKIIPAGDDEANKELSKSFPKAMLFGIMSIYFILILLFKQISQPLTILLALPLSIGGAVLGVILVKSSMSLPVMVGFLMLMGIAVKNSILMVDYIIMFRNKYPDRERIEALLDACKKRAKPIIMTTIAMGAGMLPLLLNMNNADSFFKQSIAATVLGGLITSTMLTLIVIPAFYTIIEDITISLKKIIFFIFNSKNKILTK